MAVEAEPPYSLSDADCKTMCCRYARLETKARYPHPAALVLSEHYWIVCVAFRPTLEAPTRYSRDSI